MILSKKFFFPILILAIGSFAQTAFVKPEKMRIGPVSQYGALGTNGNKIVSIASGKQVMLRGMSMFWSDNTGIPYYNDDVMEYAVSTLKTDVIRHAMMIRYYDSDGGTSNEGTVSYYKDPATQKNALDQMVKAAIENDIYLIVDWHTHRGEYEQTEAKAFFTYAAERYRDIPNIIWEVYNEPVYTGWNTIKSYAEDVIGAIRTYSPNLALVGTSNWSQNPQHAVGNPVTKTNVAYVLHFYAASHSLNQFQGNIDQTLNAGLAVFISEWGTTNANGDGAPSASATSAWTNYMDSKQISNCNWSLRGGGEQSAFFQDANTIINTKPRLDTAKTSASGTIAKAYLTGKGRNWIDSLTYGKTSGQCRFAAITEKETIGTITGKANAGCTYTSSNEAVATISGGVITIKKAGVAVMTGNDGTLSVVTATRMPAQTFTLRAYHCRLNKTCNVGDALKNYSGSYDLEQKLNVTTLEGQSISITSSNPSVISVTKATCNSTNCIGTNKGTSIWVLRFNTLGETQIHITAPGSNNYKAFDTTVTMKYRKNIQRLASSFKNITVQPGSITPDMLPDTSYYEGAQVTYDFGEGASFAHKEGTSLVAGMQDYTVNITAHAQETETYEALGTDDFGNILGITRTVTIGAGSSIKVSQVRVPFQWSMAPEGINLHLERSGAVTLRFLDASGREVTPKMVENFDAGNHWVSLSHLSSGNYFIQIRQGSSSGTFRWFKK
ncbi:MAG: cellulase family glycosylhydrolase [Fibrobacter sp.]|jgi:endoglucanase|nr:cellulase family glycosylhydrolase [Fibrobacter sp.]